jgi:hypothetical protein
VPSVVGHCGQESLVNGSTGELLGTLVVGEHVFDTVGLALDPELVAELDVALDGECLALAAICDDVVILWAGDWADFLSEFAGEVVVPCDS